VYCSDDYVEDDRTRYKLYYLTDIGILIAVAKRRNHVTMFRDDRRKIRHSCNIYRAEVMGDVSLSGSCMYAILVWVNNPLPSSRYI